MPAEEKVYAAYNSKEANGAAHTFPLPISLTASLEQNSFDSPVWRDMALILIAIWIARSFFAALMRLGSMCLVIFLPIPYIRKFRLRQEASTLYLRLGQHLPTIRHYSPPHKHQGDSL